MSAQCATLRSMAVYPHWNEERQEYGYYLDGGARWIHSPESHPDAWQVFDD